MKEIQLSDKNTIIIDSEGLYPEGAWVYIDLYHDGDVVGSINIDDPETLDQIINMLLEAKEKAWPTIKHF